MWHCKFTLIATLAVALANPALAEWRGSGKPQTAAKKAEYECAAMYYGSGKSVAAMIIGGAIANAIVRSNYIKDCMKERGFVKAATKKPVKAPVKKRASHSQPKKN